MVNAMKFLKSLSKYFVMTTGIVSLGVLIGIGSAGLYYQEQAVQMYEKSQNYITSQETQNLLPDVKKSITDMKNTVPSSIDDVKKQINDVKPKLEELKTQIDQLQSMVDQLENQLNGGGSTFIGSIIGTSKDVKEEIAKLKAQIKSLQETYNTANKFLTDAQNLIETQGNNVQKLFDEGGVVDQVDGAVDTAQIYYDKILDFFQKTPSDQFEYYWGLTANLLVWIPVGILAAGTIGGILTFLFYKNVDGKVVSRAHSKKELTKHVKYIVKKNPEILDELLKN